MVNQSFGPSELSASGFRRILASDYESVAASHGFRFSGEVPKSVKEKCLWICLCCDQEFFCRYDALKSSKLQGCIACTRENVRHPNSLDETAYIELARALNLELLDAPPRKAEARVRWRCLKCDGKFVRSLVNLRCETEGCPNCKQQLKLRPLLERVRKKSKCFPLSQPPVSSKDSIYWICPKNHEFKTSADNILQGRACKICGRERTSSKQRNTRKDYVRLAVGAKLKFIGDVPSKVGLNTEWKCLKCSHAFSASYNKLQTSQGCPICNRKRAVDERRSSPEQYRAAALRYAWEWLGPEVKSQREFTNWKCAKKGHGRFCARLSHVQAGTGCTKCGYERSSALQRSSAQDYRRLAKKTRCTWLGKQVPQNAKIKTRFKCWGENPYGEVHTFLQSYQKLLRARELSQLSMLSACTRCSAYRRQSRPQEAVYVLLKGFGRRYREKKVGKYWVDIVLLTGGKKIAIEYDGWHYHKNRLEKDRLKRAFLRDLGYLTLRIKAGQDVPTMEQLKLAISKLLDDHAERRWVEITLAGWVP